MTGHIREEKVRELMRAASDGMCLVAASASASEVMSACLTLTRTAIMVAKALGANPAQLQAAIHELLMDCADETRSS